MRELALTMGDEKRLAAFEMKAYRRLFFLVGYVEERLWWPIQSPNMGRKKKASS